MDPVSALGVAAAIAQFIDLGLRALETCRQIRDDATSSTQRNKELEQATLQLEELRKAIGSTQRTQAPRRIVEVAKSCTSAGEDLLSVLERVRGAGKQISTAKATFRAMRERRTIEKLQNVLQARQKVLDQLLIQDIWERFNVQSIKESERFATLDGNVQKLINQLTAQHQDLLTQFSSVNQTVLSTNRDVQQKLTEIEQRTHEGFAEAEHNSRNRFEQTERNNQDRVEKVERKNETRFEQAKMDRQTDLFLKSLFFPDIDSRQQSITEAAPTTFEWILDPSNNNAGSNFRQWLMQDASTYWIYGKAGSGKSTLMAYLVEQERTKQALEFWSQHRKLHILSFFFWLPGTELQRSAVGLLRSVLFQMCRAQPDLIQSVLGGLRTEVDLLPTWTEKHLLQALCIAVEAATDVCFCFFIDGLDEFTGDHNHLVDTIFQLQRFENCKTCVASRPEAQLRNRLSHCEQLRLQDLNREDITKFVKQKLLGRKSDTWLGGSETEQMATQIVRYAEGVFLWAVLVTKDILKGIAAGDTAEMLWQRVEAPPREMNELFAAMLAKVDEVHKKSLAFFFHATKLDSELAYGFIASISHLTAANIHGRIDDYERFRQLCRVTKTQILGQSAGILELRYTHFGMDEAGDTLKATWAKSILKVVCAQSSGREVSSGRMICPNSAEFPRMLEYETLAPQWVHRSAYEFLFGPNAAAAGFWRQMDSNEVFRKIWKGALRVLEAAPSCNVPRASVDGVGSEARTISRERLVNLCESVVELDSSSIDDITRTLDNLRVSVGKFIPEDLVNPHGSTYGDLRHYIASETVYICLLRALYGQYNKPLYLDYIHEHIDACTSEIPGRKISWAAIDFVGSVLPNKAYNNTVADRQLLALLEKLLALVYRRFERSSGQNSDALRVMVLLRNDRSGDITTGLTHEATCILPTQGDHGEADWDKLTVRGVAESYLAMRAYLDAFKQSNDPLGNGVVNWKRSHSSRILELLDRIAAAVDLRISLGYRPRPGLYVRLLFPTNLLIPAGIHISGKRLPSVAHSGKQPRPVEVACHAVRFNNWERVNVPLSQGFENSDFIHLKPPVKTATDLSNTLLQDYGDRIWDLGDFVTSTPAFQKFAKALALELYASDQGLTPSQWCQALKCLLKVIKRPRRRRTYRYGTAYTRYQRA